MNWRWISLAALLGALVIGYGALIDHGPSPATGDAQAGRPGYYLRTLSSPRAQKDGSVSLRLIADQIEQQRRERQHQLETVRVNYFSRTPINRRKRRRASGSSPRKPRLRPGEVSASYNCTATWSCGRNAQPTAFLRTDALAIDTQTTSHTALFASARALRRSMRWS